MAETIKKVQLCNYRLFKPFVALVKSMPTHTLFLLIYLFAIL